MDWCEGLMEAVGLRQSEWQRLIESGKDGSLMIPIMIHILDQHGKSVLGVPQEELGEVLDQAVSEIAMSVYKIYAFWHSKLS
jgi:yecA family protein